MSRLYFPSVEDASRLKRDALISQAVEAYKAFFPAVSMNSLWNDNRTLHHLIPNRDIYFIPQGTPLNLNVLTPNSDTPYGLVNFDLSVGPVVVDWPAGRLFGLFQTLYFEWVGNTGLVGPDKGEGGKYLITPPSFDGTVPPGYHEFKCNTYKAIGLIRAIQTEVDVDAALELTRKMKFYPLGQEQPSNVLIAPDDKVATMTPVYREDNIAYWEFVHEVMQDAVVPHYRHEYGRLARLGIKKGEAFQPDDYQKEILNAAAQIAIEQMTVEAFASHDGDCRIWPDRNWEWAGVIGGSGYETENYRDQFASDRWFFQATFAAEVMFPRKPQAGSEYLLGLRDKNNEYLDGSKTYKLVVPPNVPANLFWSVTVYDPRTRSLVVTDMKRAAARSVAEQFKVEDDGSINLFFGPDIDQDQEQNWVQTLPDRDWFCYFRTYGPAAGLYNGAWKLGDIEEI